MDSISATLGVIFVQPTGGLPQEATLTWGLFSEKFPTVRSAATDEAGPLPYRLMPDDNVLVWRNFLKNPTVPTLVDVLPPPEPRHIRFSPWSMLCILGAIGVALKTRKTPRRRTHGLVVVGLVLVGLVAWPLGRVSARVPLFPRPQLSLEQNKAVIHGLLRNIYLAFDYRKEEAIYDTLSMSTTGSLLSKVYLETRKSLELQSQGGARVKVKKVEIQDLTASPLDNEPGFLAKCQWSVTGSVGHWGHIHNRTNQYDAIITVKVVNGVWKITDIQVLEEKRITLLECFRSQRLS